MNTTTTLQPEKLNFRRYQDGETSFKSWRQQIFQASWSYKCPTYIQSTPPCQGSCPAGEDIRSYLNIVAGIEKPPKGPDGKPTMSWQEYAWRRITEANPFPAIMGRVCPAPCQTGCNRNKLEGYVGINSVEHYLGNWALEHGLKFAPPAKETGRRVAIVGGGVAGLSAAYHLRRRGHAVVVFEAFNKLGGMLSFGLPDYRTPHDVVDAEIQRILDMGVESRVNVKVGVDVSLADLKRDFDAVYLGIGAQRGSGLDVPGNDAPNVVDGLSFLHDYNEGTSEAAGRRIVVIGGGDTAMDCASVARRLGARNADGSLRKGTRDGRAEAEVVIAYRRTIAEMPALKHEIAAVLQEGVRIEPLVVPIEVVKDGTGRATALRVQDVEWVNKKMVKKEGTVHDIPCDLVVTAIGQVVDWTGMDGLSNDRGLARVDKNLVTEPGVFVGGDAIKPHLLTTAIGHGRDRRRGHRPLHRRPRARPAAEGRRQLVQPRKEDAGGRHPVRDGGGADPRNRRQQGGDPQLRRPLGPLRDPGRGALPRALQPGCARRASRARDRRPQRPGQHRRAADGALRERDAGRGQALHELRHVLRVRQLHRLLPAGGGHQGAEEGGHPRPLRDHRLRQVHRLPHLQGRLPHRVHPDGARRIAR